MEMRHPKKDILKIVSHYFKKEPPRGLVMPTLAHYNETRTREISQTFTLLLKDIEYLSQT